MIKEHRIILLAAIFVAIASTPAFCDGWAFKPGLWEVANIPEIILPPIPPNLSPEARAQLEKLRGRLTTPPESATVQTCVTNSSAMKSLLDPASHPPGVCTETVISESKTDREIENVCAELSPPLQGHRHIVLTGAASGLIDQADITAGRPGNRLTRQFRWLGADCGTLSPN